MSVIDCVRAAGGRMSLMGSSADEKDKQMHDKDKPQSAAVNLDLGLYRFDFL